MELKKLTITEIESAALEAYNECKDLKGGKNADYIPFLADIPSDLFGLSIILTNGKTLNFGDTEYLFGVESISKVFTALLVMKETSPEILLEKIGADATGLPFNSIFALLLENDHPSTPLVNAGAITACSMITPIGDSNEKWNKIICNFNDLCGDNVEVIDELYRSESATNFNNRSISWLLKDYGRIYDNPDMSLDLYTRQCSIGVTSRMLGACAATIAAGGINPVTGKRVFDASFSPYITSLIATVGFYQTTGDWMYTTGIPAKSGVGGGIMAVVPGLMGIAAFSPPLDPAGNSLKGQEVIKSLANKLGINIFNGCSFSVKD